MPKIPLSSLKLDDWSLCERAAWLAACATAGPLGAGGFAADWHPATIRSVERGYGTYLAWLAQTGRLQPNALPKDRVDAELIERFFDGYAPGRAETTVATVIRGIAYMVRATHPPKGLSWLTELAHRLTNAATPSRPKLPRMATTGELSELGFRLMEAGLDLLAEEKADGARLYRDGLMIATLIARPVRLRNFSSLRVGHNFHRRDSGYEATFARRETKKQNVIAFAYPDWLTEPFDLYLRTIRSLLSAKPLQEDQGWLWIGRKGGHALRPISVTTIIVTTAKTHLGRPVFAAFVSGLRCHRHRAARAGERWHHEGRLGARHACQQSEILQPGRQFFGLGPMGHGAARVEGGLKYSVQLIANFTDCAAPRGLTGSSHILLFKHNSMKTGRNMVFPTDTRRMWWVASGTRRKHTSGCQKRRSLEAGGWTTRFDIPATCAPIRIRHPQFFRARLRLRRMKRVSRTTVMSSDVICRRPCRSPRKRLSCCGRSSPSRSALSLTVMFDGS